MRRQRGARRGLVALVLAGAAIVATLHPASAAIEQGTYSWWRGASGQPAGGWNGLGNWLYTENDPTPGPGQVQPAYFYSHQFGMDGTGADGGYIGVQKDSNGKRAIFSIWGATATICSPVVGAVCKPFGGEGTGQQTLIPYNWQAGHFYFTYVVRGNGGWWNGWIYDYPAKTWTAVGSILVPSNYTGISNWSVNWVEWYGPEAASCSQYPRASVYFYPALFFSTAWNTGVVTTLDSNVINSPTACLSSITGEAPPWQHHVRGTG